MVVVLTGMKKAVQLLSETQKQKMGEQLSNREKVVNILMKN